MVLRFISCLFFTLIFSYSHGQTPVVQLSARHIEKLEKVTSFEKKLKRYRKYIHKDSIRFMRKMDKFWQAQSDSMRRAAGDINRWMSKKKRKLIEGARVTEVLNKTQQLSNANILRNGNLSEEALEQLPAGESDITVPVNEMNKKLGELETVGNHIVSDVKGNEIISKGEAIKEEAGGYVDNFNQHKDYVQLLEDQDTLKSVVKAKGQALIEEQATKIDGFETVNELKKQIQEVNSFEARQIDYKNQAEQYTDSTFLKEQAKKKAEELAMKYISEHPEIMNGVKTKVNLLMKKYSVVPNSNDLSTAIKRTSLKGRTFRERLVIAANFQTINLDPVTIDFAPTIGYKFNKRFLVGIGGTYRQKFSTDSIPKISPDVWGYKAFTSYDVLSNFFAYGEYERNSPGVKKTEGKSTRMWNQALLAGAGRKFSVHRKIDMTIVVAYNFLHEPSDPVYPRPWVVRVGFQTSEIAMLKRRPER